MDNSGTVKNRKEVFAEEVNEVIEPVEGAEDGSLLRLVTLHKESCEDWNNFRVELECAIGGIFEVFKEVAKLL